MKILPGVDPRHELDDEAVTPVSPAGCLALAPRSQVVPLPPAIGESPLFEAPSFAAEGFDS